MGENGNLSYVINNWQSTKSLLEPPMSGELEVLSLPCVVPLTLGNSLHLCISTSQTVKLD